MRNIIFTSALLLMSQLSFGQSFVQANDDTGFTYDCDNLSGAEFSWNKYFPFCVTGDGNGDGGWNEEATNELKFSWGQSVAGRVLDFIAFTTPLDLSGASNQKIKFDLKSSFNGNPLPLTYQVFLERGYAGSTVRITDMVNVNVTGSYQTFEIDFSGHIVGGENLSVVDKLVFQYDNCPTHITTNGDLFMRNMSGGSLLLTSGIENSTLVANANLFPNPSNGLTRISAELPSSSDVKITLMDIYGKEVKAIAEGNFTSINESFDVSDVAKGTYFVHYTINGKAAKVQRLVVR